MSDRNPNRGLIEGDAFAALQRVTNHAIATGSALTELAYRMAATDPSDLRQQVESLADLHRLFGARLGALLRQLGEGAS